MKFPSFKDLAPYLVAILLFIILSLAFFYPVIQGKRLQQGDITRFKGMSKELVDYRTETGEEALWANNMFSGMPAYMTSVKYPGNLITHVDRIIRLGLPHPADYVFLYFIGFFILLLVLRVNPWLSLIGSFAFAFSSYFFVIIEAGHNTKAVAIAYMAPVLAGIILAFRGKYIIGAILTALFLALELKANHLQITYYLLLIVVIYGIYELVETIRHKTYARFFKAFGILLIAAFIAVLTHATNLWIASDHSQYTTRGKSELTMNETNQTSGLGRDYVTAWSYGVAETFTLFIPDFMGGSTTSELSKNSEFYKVLRDNNVPIAQANNYIKQLPVYWGTQPFTSGPVYVGAIVFFFFVLALFIVKGKYKWWLLSVAILSIFLSWGKNFMVFTDFFLDYVPGYSKFRAVTIILVMAELAIPLLAIIGISKILKGDIEKKDLLKYMKYAAYILGAVLLLFILVPGMFFNFNGIQDGQLQKPLIDALIVDRKYILRMDSLRSLIFIGLSFGLIWLWVSKKINYTYVLLILGVLILADMWSVNRRYLDQDNFVRKSKLEKPYQPTVADNFILNDKDPNFKVLNLSVSPFNDGNTPYFHKSIGGYHGAKLGRYQELIEYQISPEIEKFSRALQNAKTMQDAENILAGLPVLNMLNTRYIIVNPQSQPIINRNALGNVWLVDDYQIVNNADEEIMALTGFDPATTAIIDKRFEDELNGLKIANDSLAAISFLEYKPNYLKYTSNTKSDQLAVFSEIYYKDGWNAYIDGELYPHFRVNYVLRAMVVPEGSHTIEFKFEPEIYKKGEAVSLASSLLLILLVVGVGGYEILKALKAKK